MSKLSKLSVEPGPGSSCRPARYPCINPRFPHLLHGADYNPDQWLASPQVLSDDVRLMNLAGCNVMSVGIFAWSRLEPREGEYDFGWLDETMDRLSKAGVAVMLATPSGARSLWMSLEYPEVNRWLREGRRVDPGKRHDHCPSSPIYREACRRINARLAERYGRHPALLAWHVSNEYGGECWCELCLAAFRQWARDRFGGDIEACNQAWWADFWSRRVTCFEDLQPYYRPLDWRRFTSWRILDFYLAECEPLRRITPDVPVTTNFMGLFPGIDYAAFAPHVDFVCWDAYPHWHRPDTSDARIASEYGFVHDMYRSMKGGRPWVLMESQPAIAKGSGVLPLKRPGLHVVSSLQAIAHGSDSVQYFQWRKGRGGEEKFHGAVVDHVGHENTRGFREVAEVGRILKALPDAAGMTTRADVAMLYDWECRWALESDGYLGKPMQAYPETCREHYLPLWRRGVSTDVVSPQADLSSYRLVIAPLLYLLRRDVDQRLADFAQAGGTLVATYGLGMVDEHDRAWQGGWPGGALRQALGVWNEEHDGLYPGQTNPVNLIAANDLGLSGTFAARDVCAILHAEGADVVATYGGQFYAGTPAITRNCFGSGQAWYLGARLPLEFLDRFYTALGQRLELRRAVDVDLPEGVSATYRTDGKVEIVFLLNFASGPRQIEGLAGPGVVDAIDGAALCGAVDLAPYGCRVLRRPARPGA
jgi:beta-galactosidase